MNKAVGDLTSVTQEDPGHLLDITNDGTSTVSCLHTTNVPANKGHRTIELEKCSWSQSEFAVKISPGITHADRIIELVWRKHVGSIARCSHVHEAKADAFHFYVPSQATEIMQGFAAKGTTKLTKKNEKDGQFMSKVSKILTAIA